MSSGAVFLVYRGRREGRSLFAVTSSVDAAREVATALHAPAYRDADLGFGAAVVCDRFAPTLAGDGHGLTCAGETDTCLTHERSGDGCSSRLIWRCSVAIERVGLDLPVPREPRVRLR